MHFVRHRHHATLQHPLVDLFLLHAFQLGFQILFIDRLPYRCRDDGFADFLAERMLFSELVPVGPKSHPTVSLLYLIIYLNSFEDKAEGGTYIV